MYKIGDFSKLCRLSVRTLRLYDELGLLKPLEIDQFTGYRYYGAEQLPRLNRILALKDLGLSLDEIVRLLTLDLPAAQLRGMLRLKQAELHQQLAQEQERLARVEARLRLIEQEDAMPEYEVVLKRVEPQLVASIRDTIPNWEQVTPTFNRLFDEINGYVYQHGGKPTCAFDLWHDMERRDTDMTVEVVASLEAPIPGSERVKVYTLPGAETMASVVHHGSFAGFDQAYDTMARWIEANGYRIAGPNRELYHQYDRNGNPDEYVTELQFPVEKA